MKMKDILQGQISGATQTPYQLIDTLQELEYTWGMKEPAALIWDAIPEEALRCDQDKWWEFDEPGYLINAASKIIDDQLGAIGSPLRFGIHAKLGTPGYWNFGECRHLDGSAQEHKPEYRELVITRRVLGQQEKGMAYA